MAPCASPRLWCGADSWDRSWARANPTCRHRRPWVGPVTTQCAMPRQLVRSSTPWLTPSAGWVYESGATIEQEAVEPPRRHRFDVFPVSARAAGAPGVLGDTLEKLREFDLASQRSARSIETVASHPHRELCPLSRPTALRGLDADGTNAQR